ncbi:MULTISPECIES: UbiA family prenyltransferase [unclassified Methanoregula]|uniref:UbiA family prenyltransferase n=1 Tax=unclassified Methanoregula TaxID=2649730 RepID=UPI0025D88EFE|nr:MULTISPECIES: UbiA family prenyltransferase [unclassified Methanoregula]
MIRFNSPTLRLLNSSTVVAIAGGLRLNIAFLLASAEIHISEYIAFTLIIYATYTLDRALDCKEDIINKSEFIGADGNTAILVCTIAFIAGTILLAMDGILLAPFFPFIVGYVYTRGIRVGRCHLRLKGGAGMKNFIIGVTWGGTIALIVSRWCNVAITVLVIFLFYTIKLFITSCINDFKDVRGDLAAGIRTLPVSLGERTTKEVLLLMNIVLHCIMIYAVFYRIIGNEWVILVYSLIINTSFLIVYSSSFEQCSQLFLRRMRWIVIYWESAISLALRAGVAA